MNSTKQDIIKPGVYTDANINFTVQHVKDRQEPRKVLLCTPKHFDIIDVKNVHMEGNAGNLDKAEAAKQWNALKAEYDKLAADGLLEEVLVIEGAQGCEDMVFTANQSFPWVLDNDRIVILSKMRHPSRQLEVPYFENFYKQLGYKTMNLNHTDMFEGMGDTIPHPGKSLLYGGYGHRSKKDAYEEIAVLLQVPIVVLELIDERFYHLDTCFVPLSEETVMLCREAFSDEAYQALEKMFKKIVHIPVEEAIQSFSLNAHVLNIKQSSRKVALIHKGSNVTRRTLLEEGYEVIELNTSEFMKSGGSVFCMKMMVY